MSTSESPPEPSRTEKVLGAIGGVQALAVGMTRQASEFAADRLPRIPGFPADALTRPSEAVDRVLGSVEGVVGTRSATARDVVHQQAAFGKGMVDSVQPIVDALGGRRTPPA